MGQPIRIAALLGALLVCGCEPPADTPSTDSANNLPPGAVAVGATPAQAETVSEPQVTDSEVAAVGVGDRGQGYGNDPFTAPAATYWRAQEKIAFEIEIPHALQLYKALNPEGKGPVSHEAFMQDVIAANRIKLPELPEGKQYRYDPQTETLFVDSFSQSP